MMLIAMVTVQKYIYASGMGSRHYIITVLQQARVF